MKQVSDAQLSALSRQAGTAARRRSHLNLHEDLTAPVQRFLNAIEPESYVRPHRHVDPLRWELFVALAGRAVVLTFDPAGCVDERLEVAAGGPIHAVEIEPGRWHTVAAAERGTVLFEFKEGPYSPLQDKHFAAWAPAEGQARCPAFVAWYRNAQPGDRPPPA